MNLICIREKLKEGVDMVARMTGEHPTLAIVKNILIEADKERIKLTATNLEFGIQYTVPGKVVNPGSITVPAGLLTQVLGNLTEDRVTLEVKDGVLELVTDSYQAKLQGTPADEFPLIPKLNDTEEHLVIEAQVLQEALEKALAATQHSDLRPELNSVFMVFERDKLTFAATDSFRLAEKVLNESEFTSTFETDFRILIPLKTAQETVRLLKRGGKVKVSRDENQILVTTGEAEFISRLVDGNFPDYQAIVPKEFSGEAVISSAELGNALKLASAFSGSVPEVSLKIAAGGKAVEIFSRDEKLGENRSLIPAKIKGDFTEVTFNWKYLLDGVRAADSKEIVLQITDETRPAMVRPKDDGSYFYIVMPILKG